MNILASIIEIAEKIVNCFVLKILQIVIFVRNAFILKETSRQYIYVLQDTYKEKNGDQIIIAKIIDSPRGVFKMSAIELVGKRKDILSGFCTEDIVTIVNLATIDKEPSLILKQSPIHKYYGVLAMMFGAMLMISNITATKLTNIFGFTMTGAFICYPITYVLNDIITEVYGYKKSRQLIWGAIACNLIMVILFEATIAMPEASFWHNQKEFTLVLGSVPKIVIGSLLAYCGGSFLNAYIIAKYKVVWEGGGLISRIFAAAFFGISFDTIIFVTIAFGDVVPFSEFIPFAAIIYFKKLICEFVLIPLTIYLINTLKAKERLDIYDYNTNFTPLSFDVIYTEANNKFV